MFASAHPEVAVAKSGSVGRTGRHANPIVRVIVFWHLFSLDAPTVAILWTWFLAKTNHIGLAKTAIAAMGIAVWMLYAADRLLDTRALPPTPQIEASRSEFEPRHHFHLLHQQGFRIAIFLASILLAALLPALAPQAIRLYCILGTLLIGYFVVIHVRSEATRETLHRLPKEIAVGVFFSAATFIPTVARNPAIRLVLLPGAILFGVLCSLNCLFIYAWEHPAGSPNAHPATRIALRFLPSLSVGVTITGILLSIANHSLPWPIPLSCATSALLLLLVHENRRRFAPTTLRAVADICLLTPLLLLRF